MKLYMVNYKNSKSMAISDDGKKFIVFSLSKNLPEYLNSIENFLDKKNNDYLEITNFLKTQEIKPVDIEDKDILPPISRPKQNIMCMGLNYEDHIKESEKDQNGNPKIGLIFDVPKGYEKKNIKFLIAHHNQFWLFDSKINELWNPLQDPSIKNGILEI